MPFKTVLATVKPELMTDDGKTQVTGGAIPGGEGIIRRRVDPGGDPAGGRVHGIFGKNPKNPDEDFANS